MSLQVDYRPKSFKTFVGNSDTVEGLKNILKRDKKPSAFLFTGSGGTGKTTLGRIVAKALNCKKADYREINASNETGVKNIRVLLDSMQYSPLAGKTKVYLLDEAHMLSKASQEALLKGLEEPPPYVHFIVCTTNPEALKPTFKRRCHHYELDDLLDKDILKLIKMVLKAEKVNKYPQDVIDKITELCNGSAGIALKLLDQVIDFTDSERALSSLKSTGATESEVIDLCRVIVDQNITPNAKWNKTKKLLKNLKTDGESARRPILGYLSSIMLNKGGDDIAFAMEHFENNFFDSGKAGLILACYKACMEE